MQLLFSVCHSDRIEVQASLQKCLKIMINIQVTAKILSIPFTSVNGIESTLKVGSSTQVWFLG